MKTILAKLPNLSQRELTTIKAACDSLLDKPKDAPVLYLTMLDFLGQTGPSYASFQKTVSWRPWQQNQQIVSSFVSSLWPGLSKVQEVALTHFLLSLLADDLKYLEVPVSIGSLSVNLGRLPELFDRSFPGYRENGLAGIVLSSMVSR